MKGAVLLVLAIAGLSAFGYFVLNGKWWLGLVVGSVSVALIAYEDWSRRYQELKRRDRTVRKVVSETLGWGGTQIPAVTLVAAIGTPDVMAAHAEAKAKEDELWAQRNRSER